MGFSCRGSDWTRCASHRLRCGIILFEPLAVSDLARETVTESCDGTPARRTPAVGSITLSLLRSTGRISRPSRMARNEVLGAAENLRSWVIDSYHTCGRKP
jgi:hypothetical protein